MPRLGNKRLLLSAFGTYLSETDDFIFIKDVNLVYIASSLPFARMVGCDGITGVAGKTDFDLFTDKNLASRYVKDDRRMLEQNKPLGPYIEPTPAREDGKPSYARTRKSLIRDRRGNVIGVYGAARDVTNEYVAQLNYERERRYLLELPEDSYWAMLIDVADWRIVEFRHGPATSSDGPDYADIDSFAESVTSSITEGSSAMHFFSRFTKSHFEDIFNDGIRNLVYKYKRHMFDGQEHWVREEIHVLINPITQHTEALLTLFNIDEQIREKNQLVHLAEHDSMTGLLNHEATMAYIKEFLSNEGAHGRHALFMIDIDNFKSINDTLGHQRGDDVIIGIATALRGAFRDSDIVGRIGGDEFLALMKNVDKFYAAEPKAISLVSILGKISAGDIKLSGSVGVTMYQGDGKSVCDLYAEADAALYRAKNNGKNCFIMANPNECI